MCSIPGFPSLPSEFCKCKTSSTGSCHIKHTASLSMIVIYMCVYSCVYMCIEVSSGKTEIVSDLTVRNSSISLMLEMEFPLMSKYSKLISSARFSSFLILLNERSNRFRDTRLDKPSIAPI